MPSSTGDETSARNAHSDVEVVSISEKEPRDYAKILGRIEASLTGKGINNLFVTRSKRAKTANSIMFLSSVKNWIIGVLRKDSYDTIDFVDIRMMLDLDVTLGRRSECGLFWGIIDTALREKFSPDLVPQLNEADGLDLLTLLNQMYNSIVESPLVVQYWENDLAKCDRTPGASVTLVETYREACNGYFYNSTFSLCWMMYRGHKELFPKVLDAYEYGTQRRTKPWYENLGLMMLTWEKLLRSNASADESVNRLSFRSNRKRERSDDQRNKVAGGDNLKKKRKKNLQKLKCFGCKQRGHLKRNCPNKQGGQEKGNRGKTKEMCPHEVILY